MTVRLLALAVTVVAGAACSDVDGLSPVGSTPVPPGPPPLPDCDDGNACTADHLDVDSRTCRHEDLTGPCELDDRCATAGQCSSGRCVGVPVVCEVPSPCHQGTCDPELGCVVEPLESRCDDDDPCTIDRCTENGCTNEVVDDGMPCAGQGGCTDLAFCQAGSCEPAETPEGYPCEDGDPCTVGDSCLGDACVSGGPAPASGPVLVDRFLTFGAPGGAVVGIDGERLLFYDSVDDEGTQGLASAALTVVIASEEGVAVQSQTFAEVGPGHVWGPGPLTPLAPGMALLHGAGAPAHLVVVDAEGNLTLGELPGNESIAFGALAGHVLFVGAGETLWDVAVPKMFDITNPSMPVELGELGQLAEGLSVDPVRQRLFVSHGEGPFGLTVYDVVDPEVPIPSEVISMTSSIHVTTDPYDPDRLLFVRGGVHTIVDAETLEALDSVQIAGGFNLTRTRLLRNGEIIGIFINDAGPSNAWYWPSDDGDELPLIFLAGSRSGGDVKIGVTASTLAVIPDERSVTFYDLQGGSPVEIEGLGFGAPGLLVDRGDGQPPALARSGRVASVGPGGIVELGLRWDPGFRSIRLSGTALGSRTLLLQPREFWTPGGTDIVRADADISFDGRIDPDPDMLFCSRGPDDIACFLDVTGFGKQVGLYRFEEMVGNQIPVPFATLHLDDLGERGWSLGPYLAFAAGWLAMAETASTFGSIGFFRVDADGGSTPAGFALSGDIGALTLGEHAAARLVAGPDGERLELVALDPNEPSTGESASILVPGAHRPIWIGNRQIIVSTSTGLQWINFSTDPPALTYQLDGVAQDARSMVHHAGLLYAASDHDVVVLEPACAGP